MLSGATTLLTLALSVVGQCQSNLPGRECPPTGVKHPMVLTLDGSAYPFVGWHDIDGRRHYQPDDYPDVAAAVVKFRARAKVVGLDPMTHGVFLPEPVEGETGPKVVTNDAGFGARWEAGTAKAERAKTDTKAGPKTGADHAGPVFHAVHPADHFAEQCPGPGPCPNPKRPAPGPKKPDVPPVPAVPEMPEIDLTGIALWGVVALLLLATCAVFVVALVLVLRPRHP